MALEYIMGAMKFPVTKYKMKSHQRETEREKERERSVEVHEQ